jgi:hypothetical protein
MWLFDVPSGIGIPLFTLFFVGASWLVLLVLRRWVLRSAKGGGEWDRILGYAITAYGVFYGVTLAMIAAAAYQNFADVDGLVLQESSSVAVLYRDASGFPEPTRTELQEGVIAYAHRVVDVDWPRQAAGEVPEDSIAEVTRIQDTLFGFQPETTAQTSLQSNTIAAFNQFVADRRARIEVSGLALPGVLWVVLGVGAVLNAVLLSLIEVRSIRVHLIMSGLIAVFVALLIYAIASFDHPYMGPVAVGPEYFVELLQGLLAKGG